MNIKLKIGLSMLILLSIIEGIILLSGYYIFDHGHNTKTETNRILNRGATETTAHFWIFYHLKAYLIVAIFAFLSLLFRGHTTSFLVLWDVLDNRR
jgi:hypothetical protein